MKQMLTAVLLTCLASGAFAQKYLTRSGKVSFFSSTPVENIEAFNNEVAAVYDNEKGEVVFQVPIKSFKFEKQLMQEHFNENYMESDKYPKATFKGTLNRADISAKDGSYKTTVKGKMTIHGVTKEVQIPGVIVVKGNQMTFQSKFKVATADYDIKIPSIAASKIAKEIEVTVDTILQKM